MADSPSQPLPGGLPETMSASQLERPLPPPPQTLKATGGKGATSPRSVQLQATPATMMDSQPAPAQGRFSSLRCASLPLPTWRLPRVQLPSLRPPSVQLPSVRWASLSRRARWGVAGALLALLALIIGLSAGLATRHNSSSDGGASAPSPGSQIVHTTGGVQAMVPADQGAVPLAAAPSPAPAPAPVQPPAAIPKPSSPAPAPVPAAVPAAMPAAAPTAALTAVPTAASTPSPSPPPPSPPPPPPPSPPPPSPPPPSPPPPSPPPPSPPPLPLRSWQEDPRARQYPDQAKRGMGWQFIDSSGDKPMRFFDRISWAYNWKVKPDPAVIYYFGEAGVEFVPMQWGRWEIEDLGNMPADAKHLLVFNEPNHATQAAILPKEAAELWPEIQRVARERGVKISSPTVSPCGGGDWHANPKYADPFVWMDEFLSYCRGCEIDFISVHYYSSNFDWMKGYLYQWYKRYKKPVWLTEFAAPFADQADANAYLTTFMAWADTTSWLERYSWFALDLKGYDWIGQGNRLMDYPTQLTQLGRNYNTYSAGGRVSSSSIEKGSDPGSAVPWSQVCSHCARLDSNASAEEQAYCKYDCGFVSAADKAAFSGS